MRNHQNQAKSNNNEARREIFVYYNDFFHFSVKKCPSSGQSTRHRRRLTRFAARIVVITFEKKPENVVVHEKSHT